MNTLADPPVFERLAALSDETRVRLLAVLEQHELTVGELVQVLQLPQPTVSRHLRILAEDGWVVSRAEGRNRHYRMATPLPGDARGLWRVVRDALEEHPWRAADRERAASVVDRRRSRSAAFFSESAGRWDEVRRELYGRRADLLPLFGLLDPDAVVAELGVGSGTLAATVAPFVARVIGVDRSPEMLEVARVRLQGFDNVELRRGELEALPLDDDAVDLAFLSLVLHYVPDPVRALAEALRTLGPGGRLVVVDMREHASHEYRERMGHLWPGFAAGTLMAWLEEAGFAWSRWRPLPPDPEAEGPLLFVAAAGA